MADEWQPPPAGLSGLHRKLGVLVFADRTERDGIAAVLAGIAEPPLELRDADNNGARAAQRVAADVIMFVCDHSRNSPVAAIAMAAPGADRPVRIALVRDRSARAIREALRAGADEVLFLPLDHEDVTRALAQSQRTSRVFVVQGRKTAPRPSPRATPRRMAARSRQRARAMRTGQ